MTGSARRLRYFWPPARGRAFSISLLTALLLAALLVLPGQARAFESSEWLWDIAFTDADTGCIVGSGGAIYRTTDGGTTWSKRTSGTAYDLYGLDFASATHGWAVGDHGTILKTTNGGSTWTAQNSGTEEKLRDVVFTDADHGWAVGDFGAILVTTNGGTDWTPQADAGLPLRGVFFLDNLQGWIVGDTGTILTTVDGGANWTPQTSGTSLRLYSIAFTDATHGCAVGNTGTILTTSDGGANWTPRSALTGYALRKVFFTNATTAWAVGSGGLIIKSTNSGVNWTKHSSGTELYLLGVFFTDDNNGWICGENATLLSTTTGEWPDVYAPTTTASEIDQTLWYNTAQTITLTAVDNYGGSGVAKTEYKIDDGGWTTGTSVTVSAPANHSNDGSHTVTYRSTDVADNVEADQSLTVKIDTAAPDGTFVLEGDAAETPTRTITGDSAVTDANGPLEMRISTDEKATWSEWDAYSASTSVTLPIGFGMKTVYAQYRDVAGNVRELSDTIELVDKTAPTTTASGASATVWYRTARTITFTAADNAGGSGVAKTEYSRDAGVTWTEGTSVVVGSPNGRNLVYYRSTDVAGNVETKKSIRVNIDTVGPTTYAKYVSGYRWKYLPLYYKIADKFSPKAYSVKVVVKNSSGKTLKTFYLGTRSKNTWYKAYWKAPKRGTYRYYVYAKDAAGNTQRVVARASIVAR